MRSRSWSEKPTSEISLTAYRLHQESSKTVQAASNGDCEKEGAATCQAHAIKETRHSLSRQVCSRRRRVGAGSSAAPSCSRYQAEPGVESAAAIATRCMTAVSMALPSAEAPLRLAQLPEELIVFVAAQLGGVDAMASFGRASRSCCEAVRKCRASLALFTSDWVWQSDVESPSGIMVHGETVVLLSDYSLLQLWPDETYMVHDLAGGLMAVTAGPDSAHIYVLSDASTAEFPGLPPLVHVVEMAEQDGRGSASLEHDHGHVARGPAHLASRRHGVRVRPAVRGGYGGRAGCRARRRPRAARRPAAR